jgi:BirA family biotin operon repressor/biotin-[acetyl-CoA-carboxylase] ligase
MTPRAVALIGLLADGALHSGADLAARVGVSRAAVWKLVAGLRSDGIPVESVPRRGYRLPSPVELLEAATIRREAGRHGWPATATLEVAFETDSTNKRLYEAEAPAPGRPRALFAELQRAGRGRRGRDWLAPFGSGLTFSVAWSFREMPAGLSALGLAIGIGAAEALRAAGLREVRLKWPNDLVWRGRKLGGLLLQLRSEAGAGASVVAGLGLNLAMPASARSALAASGDVEIADVRDVLGTDPPSRNALAGQLVAAIAAACAEFERDGFGAFAGRWRALDALDGRAVRVLQGQLHEEGVARGVDADGALLLERGGRLDRFYSGDVSVRPAGTGAE